MTEDEWLACSNPAPMLGFLPPNASERKLRLFSIACCRLNWDSFPDERVRRAIDMAGELADGRLNETRRVASETAILDLYEKELDYDVDEVGTPLTDFLRLLERSRYFAGDAMNCSETVAHWTINGDMYTNYRQFESELEVEHTAFVHDIFGNPFHPVAFDPSWFTSTVVAISQGMYDSHDFSPMPILADALQDAGCDNADILTHCRGDGPHVRGCWVVDRLLGKE